MFETEWFIAAAGVAWAAVALIAQLALTRTSGDRDYSVRAGDPGKGIFYNFTTAMGPAHKETVRLHPAKFLIGILMHLGGFLAMAKMLLLVALPDMAQVAPMILGPFFSISFLAGFYLLVRRVGSETLRAMSSVDDYFAVAVTAGLSGVASAHELGFMGSSLFMVHVAAVFFYLPVGKLKHALFFFSSRADYGKRLGYRGVYPATSGMERK